MLIVGDSIAGTLGVGLAPVANADHYKVQFANEGDPGLLGVDAGRRSRRSCTRCPRARRAAARNPDSLFTTWRKWVDAYNPDVVLYVARGETFDQQVGGKWQNLGQASFDSYVASRYREG